MKIAILGTRGIPNHYGGFEQATEQLSVGLAAKGHDVSVYNSHNHPCQEKTWKGVHLIHCYDPEFKIGTAGQFVYDLLCILDARKRNFDLILFMGYTSSSIWHLFFPGNTIIVSNMDGMEWQRSKYSKPVRRFLKKAERLAVQHSHFHIVDSTEMRNYLQREYGLACEYIPYGASLSREEKEGILNAYGLKPGEYFLLMARMEPENNVDTVLEGFNESTSGRKFMIIGNMKTSYGRSIWTKYRHDSRIIFAGPLFDQDVVDTLRKHASIYFHGHSVGGTNPSLLEAMASKTLIAAHGNKFNQAILKNNAYYFRDANEVKELIEAPNGKDDSCWIENNYLQVQEHFNWQNVIDQYDQFLVYCYKKQRGIQIAATPGYVYE
ncbi:MAG: DUF1972 domain-containing protein [Flavisolibacter sp.]